MNRLLGSAGVLIALMTGLVTAQVAIPRDLATMADTEREFARTARVLGWRDAFLEFFADDAVTFTPDVVPAKDGLRKQPSTPFSEFELVWEPRLGDVAASGDLGWLTGPSTSTNHGVKDGKPRHGLAAKHAAAEAAAAGDFGYTYGTFEITAPKPISGAYVRLWNRDASGRWWLMVDVAQPSRALRVDRQLRRRDFRWKSEWKNHPVASALRRKDTRIAGRVDLPPEGGSHKIDLFHTL
jgi:ketosteroid isomerase-like protein